MAKEGKIKLPFVKKASLEREVLPQKGSHSVETTLALPLQARHLMDERLQTSQRQRLARQLGQVGGNRALQRLVGGAPQVVQRGLLDDFINWFRGLFASDPQTVVSNLDSALEHAHSVVEAAASATVDPTNRRRLEQVAERLEGLQRVTGGIVTALETVDTIEKVEEFVEALNDLPSDISSDPARAADAFGRLFASAGELGGLLPEGPWTPYFTWLSGARDFFTNMLNALDPARRWRRQFEEIERESR